MSDTRAPQSQASEPEEIGPGRSGFSAGHERLAVAVLGICSIGFVVALNLTPVVNNDFWIQLKVGDLIRESGQIPETVLFSFTGAASNPFVAYEWLPSLAWSHLFAIFGYEGMVVFKCLLELCVFLLAVRLSLQVNGNLVLSLFLGCLCILGINFRSVLRPELVALALGLVSLNLLHAFFRTGSPGWLLGLLPTSVLWANSHGSFLVNLALPGIFAIGWLLDGGWAWLRKGTAFDLAKLKHACGWIAVSWLLMVGASLINPYGAQLFEHVLQLSESDYLRLGIVEWQPVFSYPPFRRQPFLVIYLAFSFSVLASMLLGWRRLKPSLIFLLVPFWLLSVEAMRHITWFVIIGTYVLAHTFDGESRSRRARVASAAFASLLVLAGSFVASTYGNVRGKKPGFRKDTPINQNALAFLQQMGLSGNVFNSYEYGDQLVYHFYPAVRVAIDSRTDAYGKEYYLEHKQLDGRNPELLPAPAALVSFLDVHEVRTIVTRPYDYGGWDRAGHAAALAAAGFELVYRDRRTVILRRE